MITHLGTSYGLDHLQSLTGAFPWTQGGLDHLVRAKVVFADHCYSVAAVAGEAYPAECYRFLDRHGIDRVFCPTRHRQ
jgi:hypothetical protein